MERKELNRKITITNEERKAIISSLTAAGIDQNVINAALNPAVSDCGETCVHFHDCDKYYAVNPDAMSKLQMEIKKRGLDIQKINPAIKKLMQ